MQQSLFHNLLLKEHQHYHHHEYSYPQFPLPQFYPLFLQHLPFLLLAKFQLLYPYFHLLLSMPFCNPSYQHPFFDVVCLHHLLLSPYYFSSSALIVLALAVIFFSSTASSGIKVLFSPFSSSSTI